MLLEVADLPNFDQWQVAGARVHPVGDDVVITNELRRARAVGGVKASRSLHNDTCTRSVLTSVTPFASPEDATSYAAKAYWAALRRAFTSHRAVTESACANPSPGKLPGAFAYEGRSIGPYGPGGERFMVGVVGNVVFLVGGSALGEQWSWDDVGVLAEKQAAKIRRCLEAVSD
jgi:hypothetical protein